MKKMVLILSLIIFSVNTFSQVYPEKTVRDVNFVEADSLLYYGSIGTEPVPPLVGDTVIVTGVVMCAPYRGANPDSAETLHAGLPAIYFQDTAQTEWSGVLLRDPNGSSAFSILDSGLIIKVKAEVVEYYTTTELDLISFEASDILGSMTKPKPVLLTIDSLFEKGTANPNYLAEKWEGVYVEFKNVITSDPNVVGGGTFRIFDENNTSMVVYNKSDYIRSGFIPPQPGTTVKRIRGYIETRTGSQYGWFMINPVYLDDIEYGTVLPPNVFDVDRDIVNVQYGNQVTVTATMVDQDGSVMNGQIYYYIDDVLQTPIEMSNIDSIWSGTIPAVNDSALVSFYVRSEDNEGNESFSPTNYSTNKYFYFVLNRGLVIQDVQYSPYGSGFSGYNDYEVTISGVVTTDTSDIEGDGNLTGPQVLIQDGTGQWSGVQIFGTEADGLVRGDHVTVTGIVNENFGVTRIGNLDSGVLVTKNSSGVTLPDALIISTSDIATSVDGSLPAESYEGVLVMYQGVTVVDDNADGVTGPDGSNFGEMLVADNSAVSTRVELQDGTHDYHNFWDASQDDQPIQIINGSSLDALRGIMFYSFGNYKLIPRKNDDFMGFTDVEDEVIAPKVYSLSQNYPNPFNPTTKIEYSITSSEFVSLKVYDVLGREVATLVNNEQAAGVYSVNFNAANLTTGIYFYRIEAGSFVDVKKLLLLK